MILHAYSNIVTVAVNTFKQLLGSAFRVNARATQKQQWLLYFGRTNSQWTLKCPKDPLLIDKRHSSETSRCLLLTTVTVSSLGPSRMPHNPVTKDLIPEP